MTKGEYLKPPVIIGETPGDKILRLERELAAALTAQADAEALAVENEQKMELLRSYQRQLTDARTETRGANEKLAVAVEALEQAKWRLDRVALHEYSDYAEEGANEIRQALDRIKGEGAKP